MTREELKKEAEEYGLEKALWCTSESGDLRDAFIDGYDKCKEELDKENGKLEGKLADLQSEYIELENFYNNTVNEWKSKYAARLKEYIKLKAQIEELEKVCQDLSDKFDFQVKQVMKLESKLTKAKEIITNLVTFDGNYKDDEEYQRTSELYDKIWEEAEQFLKEADE